MREWNAGVYHRVSDPQLRWGLPVVERLPLRGNELVFDIGCGTGRLTEAVLERLPRGRVLAVDVSANMLQEARAYLQGRFPRRVAFVQADALALPAAHAADAVFSTASFHWVLDHPRLFRSLHASLKRGGRLVAQCGGAGNIDAVCQRMDTIMKQPEFSRHFEGWRRPWEFADAETTARRLADAGFIEIRTSVVAAAAPMTDAAAYKEFVGSVVCRQHLDRLPDDALRDRFLHALTEQAARDERPFVLDYRRLNMEATSA